VAGYVDIHAHVLPKGIVGKAGPYGPEIFRRQDGGWGLRAAGGNLNATTVAQKRHESGEAGGEDPAGWFDRLSDPQVRLREMDSKGIEKMVVSPAPPLYMYSIESEYAVPFSRSYNDLLAEFCQAAPGRLYFLATLPMQDLAAAVEETKRAVADNDARGFYIGASSVGGRELDDRALWPFYEAVVASGYPLCVHPGPTSFDTGEVDCYHEKLALGFPSQETHAIFRLIAGGVFDAFPDLKVLVSHGGGFFPFQIGRIQEFLKIADDQKSQQPVTDYLRNLYFDIILHDVRARRLLLEVAGPSHALLGSNYAGMDSVDGIAFINELELPERDRLQVVRENALELFRLTA
jgi:aminocarboxymuconate-semialdehyde decarboxylase